MQTTARSDPQADRRRAGEEVLSQFALALGSLRCAGSQRLVRMGISMTHFHVLTLLRHHEAMPMGRLADILDAVRERAGRRRGQRRALRRFRLRRGADCRGAHRAWRHCACHRPDRHEPALALNSDSIR